ncbi:MAG TPA: DUF2490 domain-containing protein [Pseudomonadales bacterium]|nr:DUF2490 domain-containing protein [Pseudomonadales bacterium]
MTMKHLLPLLITLLCCMPKWAFAQVDEDQLGAWYMYFWNTRFDDSRWGLQGDVQDRNWDGLGDLEQLLIRGGLTWTPEAADLTLTFGYANITSGEFGDSDATSTEHRVYQEALIPQRLGERVHLRHRFRLEQRWVEDQSFRNRFRYALFMDIPLNQTTMGRGAWYLAFYDELFVNLEHDIGGGREVDSFDRNRAYGALGYALRDRLRVQFGYMQQTTDDVDKGQVQLSLHHSF